jgi:hypothetical protein
MASRVSLPLNSSGSIRASPLITRDREMIKLSYLMPSTRLVHKSGSVPQEKAVLLLMPTLATPRKILVHQVAATQATKMSSC